MLNLPLKPSRNMNPKWAKLSVLTRRAYKKSVPRKLFPEILSKFPVSLKQKKNREIVSINYVVSKSAID